jgi:hypothetical protein
MIEVYNEELNDLLRQPGTTSPKVTISVTPQFGAQVVGAKTETVPGFKECMKWIERGNSNKTIKATAMNPQSSRGHCVFKLTLKMTQGSDGGKMTSEIYFADLAGSENIKKTLVTGDRLKELTFINSSLLHLANCIAKMSEESKKGSGGKPRKSGIDAGDASTAVATAKAPAGAPPKSPRAPAHPTVDMSKFRSSKLTLLLANALSGNSKTAMIGTLSPAAANFEESYKTLKFASQVKSIKVESTAAVTSHDPNVMVKKLQAEVNELHGKLKEARQEVDDLRMELLAAGNDDEPASPKSDKKASMASGGSSMASGGSHKSQLKAGEKLDQSQQNGQSSESLVVKASEVADRFKKTMMAGARSRKDTVKTENKIVADLLKENRELRIELEQARNQLAEERGILMEENEMLLAENEGLVQDLDLLENRVHEIDDPDPNKTEGVVGWLFG